MGGARSRLLLRLTGVLDEAFSIPIIIIGAISGWIYINSAPRKLYIECIVSFDDSFPIESLVQPEEVICLTISTDKYDLKSIRDWYP